MGECTCTFFVNLQVVNKLGNLRRISCPGNRTGTRSPAGSAGWSRRYRTCGPAGGCSWLRNLIVYPETMQLSPRTDSANRTNYTKSMRAPVAVACNRIISAESDSGLEGGGGLWGVFSRLAPAQERTLTSSFGIR